LQRPRATKHSTVAYAIAIRTGVCETSKRVVAMARGRTQWPEDSTSAGRANRYGVGDVARVRCLIDWPDRSGAWPIHATSLSPAAARGAGRAERNGSAACQRPSDSGARPFLLRAIPSALGQLRQIGVEAQGIADAVAREAWAA
jgi:hypothetical protein